MYYIDACIWRDYWENRSDRFRPLGEWAFRFLRSIADQDIVLISEMLLDELHKKYAPEEVVEMLDVVPAASRVDISVSSLQESEAKSLARERGVAFGDALHAVLARDCGATMITRDNHFWKLTDIVDVKKPEDLL